MVVSDIEIKNALDVRKLDDFKYLIPKIMDQVWTMNINPKQ